MHGGRASKGTRQEERKQGKHPIQRTASGVGFQFFQHVLGVNARGDESRTFPCHGSQELQPTLVDARDLTEIDSARSSVLRSVPIFPARPQLADPRSDQAAFESPPLFCSRLGDRNSQHRAARFLRPVAMVLRPPATLTTHCKRSPARHFTNATWFANACAYGLPIPLVRSAHRPCMLSSA